MLSELVENYGFLKYTQLEMIDGEIPLIKESNKKNCLYAIAINDELVYIGQTVSMRKRINYYRTSIKRETPTADTRKSKLIHEALRVGSKVEFYFRQCFDLDIHNDNGKSIISTADFEEPVLIRKFKPKWNTVHVKKTKYCKPRCIKIIQESDGGN